MNSLKWIMIHGGLGWGVPFALLIFVIRWIENKPPAFDSFLILLLVSIIGGMFWGYSMYKFDEPEAQKTFSINKVLKSMAIIVIIFCIYAVIFRYVLIPHDLDRHFISAAILFGLVFVGLFLHNKFIIPNKKKSA